jgi:hypothetical protein
MKVNHGFWDLHPDERAVITETACERAGVDNFYDLSPEERDAAYEVAEEE